MANIVHASDLHFGAKFDFLPVEKQRDAISMQHSALEELINFANDSQADVVLLAGDLFDSPLPDHGLSRRVFDTLSKCLCPVLISPGNHDHLCPGSPYLSQTLPGNVTVFQSRALTPHSIGSEIVVYGAAFENTSASIRLTPPADREKINILLLHSDLAAQSGYNPLPLEEVRACGFDYIAAGHNHSFLGLKKTGGTFFANTGSFCALAANETGKRGYLAGEIGKDRCALSFVTSGGLWILDHSIDISQCFQNLQLCDELRNSLPQATGNVCLRLTFTGARQFSYDGAALAHTLGERFFHYVFRDKSVAFSDVWTHLAEAGLLGETTRLYKQMYEAAPEKKKEQILKSAQYAVAALEYR